MVFENRFINPMCFSQHSLHKASSKGVNFPVRSFKHHRPGSLWGNRGSISPVMHRDPRVCPSPALQTSLHAPGMGHSAQLPQATHSSTGHGLEKQQGNSSLIISIPPNIWVFRQIPYWTDVKFALLPDVQLSFICDPLAWSPLNI